MAAHERLRRRGGASPRRQETLTRGPWARSSPRALLLSCRADLRRPSAKKPPEAAFVSVDYPREGEVIDSPSYTFRIDAAAPRVEIAIDGGGWASCRRSDGFWWFDWSDYEPGLHQALVRAAPQPGMETPARVRRFVVELAESRPR